MGGESTIETRDGTRDAAGAKSKRQVHALIRALRRNGEAFTHVTHGARRCTHVRVLQPRGLGPWERAAESHG